MFQLAFDARSFAPFAFSPVAFAIQALIEEIREEHVNGSGKAKGRTRTADGGRKRTQADGDLADLVRQQWELLELRLAEQRAAEAPPAASPVPAPAITAETGREVPTEAPAITAESDQADLALAEQLARRRDEEAAALVLLLAEV